LISSGFAAMERCTGTVPLTCMRCPLRTSTITLPTTVHRTMAIFTGSA
jgi:hypothetical protein